MKMVFTPEQKIFMIESYFHNGHQDKNGAFQEFTEKCCSSLRTHFRDLEVLSSQIEKVAG
jgi:hypothetical protein